MDVLTEAREKLTAAVGSAEAVYVGASPGDGSDPKYRGPVPAQQAVETALTWAMGAFAGHEATLATRQGDDYPVLATLTAGGPGMAPKVVGSRKKAGPAAEAKPAPEAEAKPVAKPTARKKSTAKKATTKRASS